MSVASVKRLQRELGNLSKLQPSDGIYDVSLVDENMQDWRIKVTVDPDSALGRSLERHGWNHVVLRIAFGNDYPIYAPHVWVEQPIVSGGFVQPEGGICSDNQGAGYSPTQTVESLLHGYRHLLASRETTVKNASLTAHNQKKAALDSITRVLQIHREWK